MVDFGGTSVAELTQNIKDALLDPNSFRTPATATNPLATLSDVNAGKNFLINGGFDVCQRLTPGSLTQVTGQGQFFGADRWSVIYDSTSFKYQRIDTITAPESGLSARNYGKYKQTGTPISSNKFVILQGIEAVDGAPLRGKTVRFQVKMKYSVASSMTMRLGLLYVASGQTADTISDGFGNFKSALNGSGVDPTWRTGLVALAPVLVQGGTANGLGMDCVLTSGWVQYSATFVIPSDCLNVVPAIWANASLTQNDEFNVSEAGLYLGNAILNWNPKPFAQEFMLCQRYYQKSFAADTAPGQDAGFGTGETLFPATIAGAGLMTSQTLTFSVTARINPNGRITIYNPGANNSEVRDKTISADCAASTVAAISPRGMTVQADGNAGGSVGDIMGFHWSIDTELP